MQETNYQVMWLEVALPQDLLKITIHFLLSNGCLAIGHISDTSFPLVVVYHSISKYIKSVMCDLMGYVPICTYEIWFLMVSHGWVLAFFESFLKRKPSSTVRHRNLKGSTRVTNRRTQQSAFVNTNLVSFLVASF